jgi:hypothetical protein
MFYDLAPVQVGHEFGANFTATSSTRLLNVSYPLTPAQLIPPPLSLTPPYGWFNAFLPDLKLPYTLQWNVAFEQSLGQSQSLSATYAAAAGRRLYRTDFFWPSPNPDFTTLFQTTNQGRSDYHSLQVQFQRRMTRGLQALASYTWSHSIDTESSETLSYTIRSPGFSAAQDRAASDFDIRHVFSSAVTWKLPVLRNWALDAVFKAYTASPVNVQLNPGASATAVNVRPDLVSGVPLYIKDAGLPGGRRINPAAFVPRRAAPHGTLGRNALRGFGVQQFDFAARREFRMTERLSMQLRLEMFNAFNRPNFANPIGDLNNSLFGRSTQMLGRALGGLNPLYQVGGPRSVQLGAKLQF